MQRILMLKKGPFEFFKLRSQVRYIITSYFYCLHWNSKYFLVHKFQIMNFIHEIYIAIYSSTTATKYFTFFSNLILCFICQSFKLVLNNNSFFSARKPTMISGTWVTLKWRKFIGTFPHHLLPSFNYHFTWNEFFQA